jgi:RNase H-fold protein (predicted Holliday junction resolvase)
MNERIWQLQGQAKVLAEEIVSQRKYDDYMEYKQSLMDQTMNKFAELIVQRTLAIVEAHTEIFQSDQARAMVEHIKHSVKTDFGVEE